VQLGRYRLDEQVGQGGMAVVWRGFDTQLRRTVAVKVLHAHLHAREDIRRRFDREAQAVARLHHPHILDVYDFSGLSTEPSYLVTEFIRGRTLRQFAEAHPFDPPELAAACLLPIAEALEHAHSAGVVHRDLKPENVMVREDGVVKLTDFGIAALLDPDEKFTMTGSILGSPAHLAPETIEGKAADPRSDLFSFGTIFYWLSCGELPFQAPSPAALLRSILEGKPPDPRLIRRSVSDAQARVLARCLERKPEDRYQSAAELRRELEKLLAEAGLEQPLEAIGRFVQKPEEEGPRVRARIVETCLARGEEDLGRGRTSAALGEFGRVLTLQPDNAHAQGRVEKIRRRAKLVLWGKRTLMGLAACVAAALVAIPIGTAVQRLRMLSRAQERANASANATPASNATPTATSNSNSPSKPTATPAPNSKQSSIATPASTTGNRQSQRSQPPVRPAEVAVTATSHSPPIGSADVTSVKVTLAQKVSAQVFIDDQDLGYNLQFERKLTLGKHRITVHHVCCVDLNSEIEIIPNVTRYPLPLGPARPARLKIIGADPDAQVWFADENQAPSLLGSVRDLEGPQPPQIAMTAPDHSFTIRVGDKQFERKLQAGRVNEIDMAGVP
jgi:serine/threonine-protein kinase